jgi:hypothetical protein
MMAVGYHIVTPASSQATFDQMSLLQRSGAMSGAFSAAIGRIWTTAPPLDPMSSDRR